MKNKPLSSRMQFILCAMVKAKQLETPTTWKEKMMLKRGSYQAKTFAALLTRGMVVTSGKFGFEITPEGMEAYRELEG